MARPRRHPARGRRRLGLGKGRSLEPSAGRFRRRSVSCGGPRLRRPRMKQSPSPGPGGGGRERGGPTPQKDADPSRGPQARSQQPVSTTTPVDRGQGSRRGPVPVLRTSSPVQNLPGTNRAVLTGGSFVVAVRDVFLLMNPATFSLANLIVRSPCNGFRLNSRPGAVPVAPMEEASGGILGRSNLRTPSGMKSAHLGQTFS